MHRLIRSSLLLACCCFVSLLLAGCKRPPAAATGGSLPGKKAAVAAPEPPAIDFAAVRPNELGHIPVIMYHEIGGAPVKNDPALVRSVAAFRKDLELLYAKNFRPVNLGDVINNTMDLPPGMSPVVLTFDDARASQFRLIETPDALKIDPATAVGILDAFHKKHPDWPLKATFFVLPKSRKTMAPFGQPGLGEQKLSYLVEQGMEIGNHTTLHESMQNMTPAQIQQEIGNAHNEILAAAPQARIQVVALPMGQYPRNKKNWRYLTEGTYGGKTYRYKAAMQAAYRAVPSPASKRFDPLRLERIAPIDGRWGVRWWIEELSRGTGLYPRYVSDGDSRFVSFPKGSEALVNTPALKAQNKIAYAYSPFGGGGGAKPIIGAGEAPAATANSKAAAPEASVAEKPISGG